MLRHALDVLVDNALRHGAGEVRIDHTVTETTVTISVTDEGPGFSTPTTQTEPASPHDDVSLHGLGLPLARRLVETLPGRLTIARAAPHPQIDIVVQRTLPPST
jgi:anti-sigma regulatory factor (Ser/Thr protein kinase)